MKLIDYYPFSLLILFPTDDYLQEFQMMNHLRSLLHLDGFIYFHFPGSGTTAWYCWGGWNNRYELVAFLLLVSIFKRLVHFNFSYTVPGLGGHIYFLFRVVPIFILPFFPIDDAYTFSFNWDFHHQEFESRLKVVERLVYSYKVISYNQSVL